MDERVTIIFTVEKDGISNEVQFRCGIVRLDNDNGVGLEISPSNAASYSSFIDIPLTTNEDQMKIKSKIFNSAHYKKHWKGNGVYSD